jgi:Tfp pilus assembly protein PilF
MTETASNDARRIDQLEGFLRHDPNNAALLADAVQAAVQAGRPGRARELLALAGPAVAGTSVVTHLEALVLLSEQRYVEAQALLRELVASGLESGAVLFNLGYASLRAGEPQNAVDSLRAALAQPDAPPATLAYLIRSHHHAGHADEAAAAWEGAAPQFRTPEAAAVASLAYLDLERSAEARALADEALAAGSRSAEAHVARATLAVGDADLERAGALLQAARQVAPNDGRVLSAVGVAAMARGDLAGAEDAFRRSVAVLPQHIGVWHALGWCQIVQGRLEDARRTFESALALDRNFGETHGGLAVVDMLMGQLPAAEESAERAERLDRDGLAARYARALQSGQARDPEAIRALALDLLRKRAGTAGIKLMDRLANK